MAYKLTVVHPFGDYKKGDEISDPNKVKDILARYGHRCVKTVIPDEPAPIGAAE